VTDVADPEEGAEDSIGLSVPEDHVGAFVAEAFEDVERDTAWPAVVDEVIADAARDAWADLDGTERVREMIELAAGYDERALERLEAVPVEPGDLGDDAEATLSDGLRCRRNADRLRDAVADAYDRGVVDDDGLVAAVESAEFDTATVAAREDRLDTLAELHEFEFRPYGGTLLDGRDDGVTVAESEEVW